MGRLGTVFVPALALMAALSGMPRVVAGDRRVQVLPSSSVMEIETFIGVPKWRLLPHLFSEKTVNVTCPGITDFSVYVAEDPEKLVERVQQQRGAWCGLQSLLSWDSHTCATRVSPFADTAVAVVHSPKHGRNACTFVEREQFSAWQLGRGVLGAFLFLKADALVNSIYFRLSTGTGGFVLLSFLILAFVIYRSVPNKKAMAASMALFGSTLVSAARYFVGSWFPSLEELTYNKWVGLYLAASALVGLSVTYYYDDPGNAKLNTILERGLQLGGLALVTTSTSLPEASYTAAGLLLASRLLRSYLPRIPGAGFLRRHVEKLAAPDAVSAPPPTRPQGRGGNSKTWPQANPRQRQRRLVDLYQDQPQQQAEPSEAEPSEDGEGEDYSGDEEGGYSGAETGAYSDEETSGDTRATGGTQQTGATRQTGRGGAGGAEAQSGDRTPAARQRPSGNRNPATPQPPPTSPLFQHGLVINEATGRTLQIGKPTYNKLLKDGYQVDQQRGVLTPPPASGTPNGSGRGSGGSGRGSGGRKRKSLNAAAAMALPE